MSDLEFPEFDIQDEEDSEKIVEIVVKLSAYVSDLKTWEVLSDEAESTLEKALEWIPYAIIRLNDARARLVNTNVKAWTDVHTALNILRVFEPRIKDTLEFNEMLKEEDGEEDEED
ncbi:hypothetical protein F4814DRAFT_451946 [Daldinia grandis]|nr:hypothetical protein F4814DRAFT_451946 [Daldinia grandis]